MGLLRCLSLARRHLLLAPAQVSRRVPAVHPPAPLRLGGALPSSYSFSKACHTMATGPGPAPPSPPPATPPSVPEEYVKIAKEILYTVREQKDTIKLLNSGFWVLLGLLLAATVGLPERLSDIESSSQAMDTELKLKNKLWKQNTEELNQINEKLSDIQGFLEKVARSPSVNNTAAATDPSAIPVPSSGCESCQHLGAAGSHVPDQEQGAAGSHVPDQEQGSCEIRKTP